MSIKTSALLRFLLVCFDKIANGFHHVIWHEVHLLWVVTVLIALGLFHGGHPCQSKHGVQATLSPKQDVRLQAIANHNGLGWVQAELACHAIKHEAARLANHYSRPAAGRFHGSREAPRS